MKARRKLFQELAEGEQSSSFVYFNEATTAGGEQDQDLTNKRSPIEEGTSKAEQEPSLTPRPDSSIGQVQQPKNAHLASAQLKKLKATKTNGPANQTGLEAQDIDEHQGEPAERSTLQNRLRQIVETD